MNLYLERYNARLFPLKKREIGEKRSKHPLFSGWRDAKHESDKLAEWWANGHGLGWALGPEDLIIDVDVPTKERPDKRGLESLKKLENLIGGDLRAITTSVKAPSGGFHCYLTKPPGVKFRKFLSADFPDIEFITEGSYVAIAGSLHWQGGTYRFSNRSKELDYQRIKVPHVLAEKLTQSNDPDALTEFERIKPELLATLLGELDPRNYADNDSWFRMLTASHHAVGGSAEGREVFLEWSARDKSYSGQRAEITTRWNSLTNKPGSITIGTLFDELNKAGRREVVKMAKAAICFEVLGDGPEELPEIEYRMRERQVAREIVEVLGRSPRVFTHTGQLVNVAIDEGKPRIVPYSPITLCGEISENCVLLRYKEKKDSAGWEPMRVPERLGRQVLGFADYAGIPGLSSISDCPLMVDLEGRIVSETGLDAESGVYLYGEEFPRVPDDPTKANAKKALAEILEVVEDFPFKSEPHRMNFVAMLLSLLARPAIKGPVPLFLVDGNQRGIGKSLLIDIVGNLAFGTSPPRCKTAGGDDELDKTIAAQLHAGAPFVMMDNLANGSAFGSSTLDAVLTASEFEARVFGTTTMKRVKVSTVFVATGNRIQVSKESDIIRRIAYIGLEYVGECPQARSNFAKGSEDELRVWVSENRKRLVIAGLTVLRAFVRSGETPELKAWGSYQSYSRLVRGAIVWASGVDPYLSQEDLEQKDEGAEDLSIVITALETLLDGEEKTAGEIYEKLDMACGMGDKDLQGLMKQARDLLAPTMSREPAKVLSRRLRSKFIDQASGGYWIRAKRCHRKKQLVFGVRAV